MPQVVIEAKKIYVSKEIILILEQLKQAGKGNFDETELANLLTHSAQARSLGFTTFIPRLLESIFPVNLKGKEIIWPEVTCDLDVESREMWMVYRSFLDERLRRSDVSGQEIGRDSIEDSRVFIVEILLRMTLVALALSTTNSEKSKKIINTISIFILGIARIEKIPQTFIIEMQSHGHRDHLPLFKAIIDSNEILHAHKNAITKALNVMLAEKHLILCRLIAQFSPEKVRSELTPRLALSTLEECQRAILVSYAGKNSDLSVTNGDLLYLRESNLCSSEQVLIQSQIIKLTNNIYIEKLYGLLNKNALVIQMLSKIERLITLGSWFPFVSGLIDARKLANYLQAHYVESQKYLKIGEQDLGKTSAGREFIRYHFEFETAPKLDGSFQSMQVLHSEYFENRLRQIGLGIFNDFAGLQKVLKWDLTHPQLMHGVINLRQILPVYEDVRQLPSPQKANHASSLITKAIEEGVAPDFIESLFYSAEKTQRNKMRKILERGQLHFPQKEIVAEFIKLQEQWKAIEKCLKSVNAENVSNQRGGLENADKQLRDKIHKYRRIYEELSIQIKTFCQSNEVIKCFSLWQKRKLGVPKLEQHQPRVNAAAGLQEHAPSLVLAPPREDAASANLIAPAAAENDFIRRRGVARYLTPQNLLLFAGIVGLSAVTYDTWSPLLFRRTSSVYIDPILSTKVEDGKAAAVTLLCDSKETVQSGLVKTGAVIGSSILGKALVDRVKTRNQSGETALSFPDASLPRSISTPEFPEDYEKNTIIVTNITRARALSI